MIDNPKLALCATEKCPMKYVCMRYKLKGNANDTWVEFKPGKLMGKDYCKHFIHKNSEDARLYILQRYKNESGGYYEP